jgi:hypothetical protein
VDRCCLCKREREREYVDHILLHCDVAYALWTNILNRFGMSWVMSKKIIDLFACWWRSGRPMSADLEDDAYLHPLVCLERNKSHMFQGFGESYGRYFDFVFSYVVSLDGSY